MNDPYGSGLVAEEVGEKWLPDLLERPDAHCHKIALCLLDCLYKVNFAEEKTGDYKRKEPLLRYGSYHAEKISKKNVTKLSGWKLGLPAVEIFQSRLVSILNESNNDSWSSIWRKAIEEHDQNGSLDDVDDLIVAAYRDCLSGFVDINSREGRMLASNLCHWAAFVAQMDATVENWLLKISPYACENHNAFDLLQNLADISDKQPLEAQKIWIKMLQSYNYDYPEEAIRQIFKNLITLGTNGERKAKEVVDAYILHGIDRPRMWLAEMLIEKNS